MDFTSLFRSIKIKELNEQGRIELFGAHHVNSGTICCAIIEPLIVYGYDAVVEYFLRDPYAFKIAVRENESWRAYFRYFDPKGGVDSKVLTTEKDLQDLIDIPESDKLKKLHLHLEFRKREGSQYFGGCIHLYLNENNCRDKLDNEVILKSGKIQIPRRHTNLFDMQFITDPHDYNRLADYQRILAVYPIESSVNAPVVEEPEEPNFDRWDKRTMEDGRMDGFLKKYMKEESAKTRFDRLFAK